MDGFRRRHGLHAIEAAVALLFAMLATLALTTGSAWAAGACHERAYGKRVRDAKCPCNSAIHAAIASMQ